MKREKKYIKNINAACGSLCIFIAMAILGDHGNNNDNPTYYLKNNFFKHTIHEVKTIPDDAWIPVTNDFKTAPDFTAAHNDQHWFKTHFRNESDLTQSYVLEVGTSYWSETRFFLIEDNKLIDHAWASKTGELPFAEQRLLVYRESFPFTLSPKANVTIYIKAKSSTISSPMSVMIKEKHQFSQYLEKRYLFFGLYFGSFAAIVIYNLFVFAVNYSRLNLIYALYQTSAFILVALFSGFTETNILADKNHVVVLLLNLSGKFIVFFGALFLNEYLRAIMPDMAIEKGTKILRSIAAVLIVLQFFIPSTWSHIGTLILFALAGTVFAFYLPKICNTKVPTSFIIGWSGALSAGVIMTCGILGIIPLNPLSAQIYYIGFLWEGIFVSKSIGDRLKIFYDEKRDIQKLFTDDVDHTSSSKLAAESQKQTVAILAIDIINFSQIVIRTGIERTVRYLSIAARIVQEAVESEGGTIERSLGDGFFALFGPKEDEEFSHTLRAFRAAEKIQKTMLDKVTVQQEFDDAPIQFRIGAHCGEVEIGNLGDEHKFDFGAIGYEMSVAGRLEKSCNPFKIMISQQLWWELPQSAYDNKSMNSAFLDSGEPNRLMLAYEYDPNRKFADKIALSKAISRTYFGFKPHSDLRKIRHKILLHCKVGILELVEMNENILICASSYYFGKGTRFFVNLETPHRNLNDELKEKLLDEFEVEVQAGETRDNVYTIELAIHALSRNARLYLFDKLVKRETQRHSS